MASRRLVQAFALKGSCARRAQLLTGEAAISAGFVGLTIDETRECLLVLEWIARFSAEASALSFARSSRLMPGRASAALSDREGIIYG